MVLPVSTIQHSIGTRFASLQQREVHGLKFPPSLCHLYQSNQWTPSWLNAYKSVYYCLLPTKWKDCFVILQFCLFCFPLWKETFKLKLLDRKYRGNKASHQWHVFEHLHVKLKLFLIAQHLTCRSNVNAVFELTNNFVTGGEEDRTKIPLILWYH